MYAALVSGAYKKLLFVAELAFFLSSFFSYTDKLTGSPLGDPFVAFTAYPILPLNEVIGFAVNCIDRKGHAIDTRRRLLSSSAVFG